MDYTRVWLLLAAAAYQDGQHSLQADLLALLQASRLQTRHEQQQERPMCGSILAAPMALQARLVGQAANSFIAVTCPDGSLALLDQHAAHERVRLESLSAQVCIYCPDIPQLQHQLWSVKPPMSQHFWSASGTRGFLLLQCPDAL